MHFTLKFLCIKNSAKKSFKNPALCGIGELLSAAKFFKLTAIAANFASISTGYQYKSYGTDKTTGLVTTLTNSISGSSGNRSVNYTYGYDANGRISSANGVSYTYDEAGQLKTVTKSGGSESYTYDDNGNITSRTVTTSDEVLGTQTTTDT